MAMSIAQLAKSAEIGVETVRFYQRKGLLRDPKPARSPGSGIRHYDQSDLRTLRFIAAGKQAGFTLAEIARLQELDATGDRAEARRMARERVKAIDTEIRRLRRSRANLLRLEQACRSETTKACPIIALMVEDD